MSVSYAFCHQIQSTGSARRSLFRLLAGPCGAGTPPFPKPRNMHLRNSRSMRSPTPEAPQPCNPATSVTPELLQPRNVRDYRSTATPQLPKPRSPAIPASTGGAAPLSPCRSAPARAPHPGRYCAPGSRCSGPKSPPRAAPSPCRPCVLRSSRSIRPCR